MRAKLTISELERLKAEGKIRGYSAEKIEKPVKKKNVIKGWIEMNLAAWCHSKGYTLDPEYKFHPERKWRIDWYIPELNIGIEYEGLMSAKSRHTTVKGYSGDTEKYRAAAIMGITVLRYTALNYKGVVDDLEKL